MWTVESSLLKCRLYLIRFKNWGVYRMYAWADVRCSGQNTCSVLTGHLRFMMTLRCWRGWVCRLGLRKATVPLATWRKLWKWYQNRWSHMSEVIACHLFNFYRAMHMHKRGVCCHPVSVCLWRSWVAPKRMKISSKFFHHVVAKPF